MNFIAYNVVNVLGNRSVAFFFIRGRQFRTKETMLFEFNIGFLTATKRGI